MTPPTSKQVRKILLNPQFRPVQCRRRRIGPSLPTLLLTGLAKLRSIESGFPLLVAQRSLARSDTGSFQSVKQTE